jgi:hypothetical protein
MGLGLYDLLGYGVLTPPWPADAAGYIPEPLIDALVALGVRLASATEPDYLMLPLAVSAPLLQAEWHLPPLPAWTPRVGDYAARQLVAAPPCPQAVVARWQQVQRATQPHGLVVGRAGVILARDWD